jgi:hypothetical protein
MLSEIDFKANPEFFGLPLFFLVTNKKDMLKLINSVCFSEMDLMFFHDYIKSEDLPEFETREEFDGVRYKVDITTKKMADTIYNSYSIDQLIFEDPYDAFYVEDAEFTFDFKEPLVFFINFDSGFDRYGDVLVRSISHCKLKDLLRYKVCLPEPTYFQNS